MECSPVSLLKIPGLVLSLWRRLSTGTRLKHCQRLEENGYTGYTMYCFSTSKNWRTTEVFQQWWGMQRKESVLNQRRKKVLSSQIDFRAAKKPANEPIFRIYLPYLQQRIHGPRNSLVPLLNLRLSKQALIPSQSSGIKGILEISGGVKPLIPKPQAVFFLILSFTNHEIQRAKTYEQDQLGTTQNCRLWVDLVHWNN